MSLRTLLLRIAGLIVIDAIALQLVLGLGSQGSTLLAIAIFLVTLVINAVFLVERLYPWRWLAPGLALMLLMVVYPLGYTVYVAFTNYGDQHGFSKEVVISQFEHEYYQPADALVYKWTAFLNPPASSDQPLSPDNFVFWYVDPDGKSYVGAQGHEGLVSADTAEGVFGKFGERDSDGIPKSIGNFTRLGRLEVVRYLKTLQSVAVSSPPNLIHITSLDKAPAETQKYTYDAAADTLTDHETGVVYHTDAGYFVPASGEGQPLTPGFISSRGLDNFLRVITDPNVRGPFINVFLWTIAFAVGSVFTTFVLGMIFALALHSADLPARSFLRSVLIIPYTLPAFISVLVWVGLMNPIYGPFNNFLRAIIGVSPQWFSDPVLAKIGILFINLWLGYPYMMIITTGALQSIPSDIYEASVIDGAGAWSQFQYITLPLLLVSVGPLLIGSFAFNFNNFAVIELFNKGGPPISAATPAGYTDILISYTYRLAFGGTKGIDYGFASAITLFIFAIVAGVTIFNFRFARRLEQVSENV